MPTRTLGLIVATGLAAALPYRSHAAAELPSSLELPAPTLFAPGVISGPASDGAPSFSPDGKTLFFTRSAAHWSIILESHLNTGGTWSTPTIAPFSGPWPDSSPTFSPDGSYLIYVSIRIVPATGNSPRHGVSHLWRVDRTATGWTAPVELSAAVNCFPLIFRPGVAADGTVYFTAAANGKELSLFRARFANGSFLKAEPLDFSDGSVKDVDPEISPDQTYLVFSSRRPFAADDQHEHLYVTRQVGGHWTTPVPIRYAGDTANGGSDDNDPRLSSDHRTIFFSSDRSIPVHFPRTDQQAAEDFARLNQWDNGNTHIWSIPFGKIAH